MVEFGLKLEDNKVSEWSEHYIDYEGLKKILKKVKKAQKKYQEICDEHPKEAEAVTKAYRAEAYEDLASIHEGVSPTRPTKASTIENLDAIPLAEKLQVDEDEETGTISERSALLKHPEGSSSSRSTGIVGALSKVATTMMSSQSLAHAYERKVRKSLEEIDAQVAAFDVHFYKQKIKVISFYYRQLQDVQGGFEFIVEGVLRDQGVGNTIPAETDEDSDHGSKKISPFPSHRKRQSSMGEKFEDLIMSLTDSVRSISHSENNGRHHNRLARRQSSILMGRILKGYNKISLANDEDDDDPDWDQEDLVKAEKIRRNFIDQYRVAKLLKNYAMMNLTGFVKIIKKFDKTIPLEKGRFKKALDNQCMLNDAKAVDVLCGKYEKYYSEWFCNGDTREAKAQMLAKRGDGLDMDWSQLQLGHRMGMCAILAVWVCWDCIWGLIKNGDSTIGARYAFPVFRACGGLLLLQWFWGCSVFMWTRYRVNYIYLFDFNPRIVRTPMEIIADAVDNTFIYLILMLVSSSSKSFFENGCVQN